MNGLADTPEPPYYAVVFTSVRTEADADGYAQMAEEMMRLAAEQVGYLGVETIRDPVTAVGITVSYWKSEEAIAAWRADAEHKIAQYLGRSRWYRAYRVRVARVERDSVWSAAATMSE